MFWFQTSKKTLHLWLHLFKAHIAGVLENGSEMLNTPLNVAQCSVIQNASNGVICAAHFHWPRGFIHKKAHVCCMLWESPAQLSLSVRLYKRAAPRSITPWHFAPPPLCLQLIHTRNMLTLPFMVFCFFIFKQSLILFSIHCCSLGQNCQLECKVCLKWQYAIFLSQRARECM